MKRQHFERFRGMILCLALLISAVVPFAVSAQSDSGEVTLMLKFTVNGRAEGTFTFAGDEITYRHTVRPGRIGENKYPEDITVDGKPWEDLQQPFKLDFTPDFEKTVMLECEPANRVQVSPHPDRALVHVRDSSHAAKQFSIKLAVKNQISRPKPQPAAAASGPAQKPAPGPVVITPEQKAVAAELNRQGFRMLQALGDEKETVNKFISPYSIDSAFAMLYAGVGGRTANEIRDVLGLPGDSVDSNKFFHAMSGQYQASRQSDVLVSNSAWVDRRVKLRPEYAGTLETYFEGAFYTEDFSRGEAVARKINSLVESKTKGMIKDLLAPSAISPRSRLILVNTLYFEAKWKYPFKENQTRQMPFYLFDGETKRVQMMYQKRRFQYYSNEEDNVHAVILPYEDPRFELVALMPLQPGADQGRAAMKSILARIGDKLDSWLTGESPYTTNVWLPRVDLTDMTMLKDTLQRLGMSAPFRPSSDFDPILADKGGFDSFYIESVIHKTALKMDEYSTKAAAATALAATGTGYNYTPPPENYFRADRPFLVLIRDNQTGLILFMGRINDPDKK
ncbi:MAG: serpin family protein [Lentisphaeria bacterium]|nr:serpin family protein [Lentisphaeria bacterium]